MTENSGQPAGWYPSPGDATRERYWDGTSWTTAYRVAGSSTAPTLSDSSSTPSNSQVPYYQKKWFKITAGIFAVIVLIGIFTDSEDAAVQETASTQTQSSTAGSEEPAPAPSPSPSETVVEVQEEVEEPSKVEEVASSSAMPAGQAEFIAFVNEYSDLYMAATTDLQEANIRNQRRQALCDLVPNRSISNWIGSVKTVGGNSDGDAYIDIEIAPGINIKTWNNRLSDIGDNTLIPPSDSMYETLLALEKRDSVTFSGTFLGTSRECLRTSNATEVFDMTRPDFVFKFSSIQKK